MIFPPSVLATIDPEGGVIVGVSGGKDSVATLSLCVRHFRRVEAYHLYTVPGISFVEKYLGYLERRFNVAIHRRPHFMMSKMLRLGVCRANRINAPIVRPADIERAERARTGLHWLASGQRKSDSLQRRGMLTTSGLIDHARGRLYPIGEWSNAQVHQYLRAESIPLAPDYATFGRSWGYDISGRFLAEIRNRWPEDFERIRAYFPLCGAEADQWERYGKEKEARRRADSITRRRAKRAATDTSPDVHHEASSPGANPPGEV